MNKKIYILKKDCPNIYKEEGDYYNNEYAESIEELLKKGIIEEEILNNMELKKQVLSLELAKRLKELGVEQNSLFYWINIVSKDIYPVYKVEYYNEYTSNFKIDDAYSAFTVAELGELLPKWLFGPELLEWKSEKQEGGIWAINVYRTHKTCESDNVFWTNEEKQIDAYAKMLIYIKENNLI